MSGPDWPTVIKLLFRESVNGDPCCAKCGEAITGERGLNWSVHHRRRRDGKPDSHQPQNLVILCGADNVTGCHGWAHQRRSESQPDGFWLSRIAGTDPLTVPILVRNERYVYLTADGQYSDNPPGETNG